MNSRTYAIRSTISSLLLHACVCAVVFFFPLAAVKRFSNSGQREIISIKMSVGQPSLEAVVAVTPNNVQEKDVEMELEAREVLEKTTQTSQDVDLDALERPPTINELASNAPPPPPIQRVTRSKETPEVVDERQDLPPRRATLGAAPVVQVDPMQSLAGLSDTKVDFTSNPPPSYPIAAVAARAQGVVTLKLHINEDGKVERVELVASSGFAMLDRAAIEAVMKWTGDPATRLGRPIPSVEVLPIRFRL